MTVTAASADPRRAAVLREAMADRLVADGVIGSPEAEAEAAFRVVPRHVFVPPGTALTEAYDAGAAVITALPPPRADTAVFPKIHGTVTVAWSGEVTQAGRLRSGAQPERGETSDNDDDGAASGGRRGRLARRGRRHRRVVQPRRDG